MGTGQPLPASVCLPISAWAHPERQAAPTVAKQVANISRKRTLSAPEQVIARPKKPGSRLAVISQTCDLLKAPEQMPTVEVALALETDNDKLIAEASNFASARYYRLTPAGAEPALVLDYGWREHLTRGSYSRTRRTTRCSTNGIVPGARRRALARAPLRPPRAQRP